MNDGNFESEKKSKPWHTKEWREMRERRLGNRCEQCDSTDGPFVIQHFSHDYSEPPSKDVIVWDLMREYGSYPPWPTVQRLGCPQCNRCSLTERKKLEPKWRCIGCHHEFDEPVTVAIPINNRTEKAAFENWKKKVLFPAHDDFLVAHQDLVEQHYRPAMDAYDKEQKASYHKYISGDGTATFCKKCAFLWDKKEMMLCGKCKKNYHPFKYDRCFNCLPRRRKTEVKEQQQFEEEIMRRDRALEQAYE